MRDMTMEDMGHLSEAAATERWLANWQRGIQELRAYRAAEASIGGSGQCSGTESAQGGTPTCHVLTVRSDGSARIQRPEVTGRRRIGSRK